MATRDRPEPPRLNRAALYEAVRQARGAQSLRDFCAEVGAGSPSTLVRMGKGGNPSVDALIKLLLRLGTTDLRPFIDFGGGDD